MAATSSGASGSVGGRNLATTSPSGATTNFSKFHCTSPAVPSASGAAVSVGEDRVAPGSVDVDLLVDREGHRVASSEQSSAISSWVPGSWPPNWLHGNPRTVKPASA